jgi:HD-like signal output (HDOD) protein
VVGQLAVLPSVPKSYLELRDATANAASGAAQLTAIVERDPAMSAKVLQLVNSAYFGIAHRVTSVQQAVVYLGAELLKSLALTASVFSGLDPNVHRALSLEQLQAHSMRVGRLARRFTLDPKKRDDAFTTGLVHDIGKIILALSLPDGFARMANEAAGGGAPYWELEERAFGVTHAEVGAYLLGVWGLPFSLVESVAFHHKPSDVAEGPCDDLAVLHAADALAHTTDGPTRGSAEPTFDLEFLARAGALERLPQWRRVAEEELGKETPHR